jgi:cell division protein FtsB
MLRIIGKIVFNKYVLVITGFTVWMIFFDANSLKRQKTLNNRIDEIKGMKAFYQEEIKKNELAIHELETNPEAVEKFAREKYLMKRDSEDVYIITRE